MFTVFEHLGAVDKDMLHPRRVLVRFFKRRMVDDHLRIENDNVSVVSLFEPSPPVEFQILRRQASQSFDRLGQCNDLLLPNVFAQQPGDVSVSTGM